MDSSALFQIDIYPDKRHLHAVLSRLSGASVGVFGDFCLDHYLFVEPMAAEPSIETGLRTSPVATYRSTPGGAGNLAGNLAALGFGRVVAYGVVGTDFYGDELVRTLRDASVVTDRLVRQAYRWDSQVYMKVIEMNRERDRFDFGIGNELALDSMARLLSFLDSDLRDLDALLVNQQLLTGIHTTELRQELVSLLRARRPALVLVDSRDFADEYDVGIRKLNVAEAAQICGSMDDRSVVSARRYAQSLRRRWGQEVVVTLGVDGCLVADEAGVHHRPGVHHIDEVDTVGAGDAMLAGLCAGLVGGLSTRDAAIVGNLSAGVTVRKLFQTGTASSREVLELAADPDYRYNPQLLEERGRPAGTLEVIDGKPPADIRYAVFDHDGTISTVREGWEPVMLRTMIRAILGEARPTDRDHADIESTCRRFIETTTGVQTLVQMEGLRGLVRRFGFVPERQILTAGGYKERYNRELMKFVNERLESFAAGRLSVDALTIRGAVELLRALVERGVTLYLASGTDADDVRREAAALGYAELFGAGSSCDRIYGATGDVRAEPKKLALKAILEDIGRLGGGSVVTFGDGPVELRETRRVGGFCVGVASDEVRRHGWNEAKRERLVLAGAHILVPDFARGRELVDYLFTAVKR